MRADGNPRWDPINYIPYTMKINSKKQVLSLGIKERLKGVRSCLALRACVPRSPGWNNKQSGHPPFGPHDVRERRARSDVKGNRASEYNVKPVDARTGAELRGSWFEEPTSLLPSVRVSSTPLVYRTRACKISASQLTVGFVTTRCDV